MINNVQNTSQVSQNQGTQSTQGKEIEAISFQDQRGQQDYGPSKNSSQRVGGAISIDDIKTAVDELNSQLEDQKIHVNFGVDEDTGRIVVMVKDSETGETVRQIPSEATLDFARNAQKGIGISVDTVM